MINKLKFFVLNKTLTPSVLIIGIITFILIGIVSGLLIAIFLCVEIDFYETAERK